MAADSMASAPAAASPRSLLLVVGSGRSGTSTFSGVLQRLGYHVPQPEVTPDSSNPRGFAESKWVVDFHHRLLKTARVTPADARPDAWAATGAAADDAAAAELTGFLRKQFGMSDHVLIKDPRLVWFLPLWRRVAADLAITPRCVTMLRHPASVIASASRHYGGWQGEVSRAAGWVNVTLYAERATRDGLRAFIRYEDLLDDWPRAIARVGDSLQLSVISAAPSGSIREADSFIDRTLSRPASWSDVALPAVLQDQADEVWQLLKELAGKSDATASPDLLARFDAAREDYVTYYRTCAAVAESSIVASIKGNQGRSSAGLERIAARLLPDRHRRRIPLRWRRVILAALGQSGRS
jgi:hypothetical protein